MTMKRCPVCGEKYSDTYRECPFCEEEAEAREEEQMYGRRRGRRPTRTDPGILTPILVVLIIVLALMLGWLFFGDSVKGLFGGGQKPVAPPSEVMGPSQSISGDPAGVGSGDASSQVDPPQGGSSQTDPTPGQDPAPGTQTPVNNAGELTVEQVAGLPGTLTVSKTDFTVAADGAPVKLTVSGGSGTYTWYSEDDGVASVSQDGTVTPVSAGTINVYVTDGVGKGQCIVRVKRPAGGAAAPAPTTTPAHTPATGVTLNREDITMKVGETFQLKAVGITTASTWSSSDPTVATVAADGTVTGVSSGRATVTMSYDGRTLSCIVRIR